MRRVLVTGAGGFVGRHLCRDLASAGWLVRAACRRPSPCVGPASSIETFLIPDIGPDTDWNAALQEIDAVVHLAARTHILAKKDCDDLEIFRRVNVEGTRALAAASARSGVRRFVLLGSVKAMGEETTTNEHFTENSPCSPKDPYGISKWEAELALRKAASIVKMEFVILRSPMIYGPGVGANFLRLINLIARGIPLPLGSIRNSRSLLYVENLTHAIASCLEHPASAGEVFLVADDAALSTKELVCRLAKLLGRSPHLLPAPVWCLRVAGHLLGRSEDIRRLTGSLRVSTSKIKTVLDWCPPFTVDDGLRRTTAWFNAALSARNDLEPHINENSRRR